MQTLNFYNFILGPIYFLLIWYFSASFQKRKIKINGIYKYYTKGLVFKLVGCLTFCLIYSFYYDGGDTGAYFENSRAILNLLLSDFEKGLDVMFNERHNGQLRYFDKNTGLLHYYMFRDDATFSVSILTVLFTFLGMKLFIPTSLLLCTLSYTGLWKLFLLFNSFYSKYTNSLFYTICLVPSFVFWGSGIMKDTFIIFSTCWLTLSIYNVFFIFKKPIINIVLIVIHSIIIITIKPYVLLAFLFSALIWVYIYYNVKIKSYFFKFISYPVLGILFIVFTISTYQNFGYLFGTYSTIESSMNKAIVTQEDLLREEAYGKNNYDIGNIDPSIFGILSVAPISIFTAIYRPFLWESGSPTMIISGIENLISLSFTFFILLSVNPFTFIKILRKDNFLVFCLLFSMVFALGVGIASANFGALVRYKIPLIPYFFSFLIITYKISNERKKYK